jgi:acyl dehydratase
MTEPDERDSDRADAGLVKFRLLGENQREETVLDIEREILLKRRPR